MIDLLTIVFTSIQILQNYYYFLLHPNKHINFDQFIHMGNNRSQVELVIKLNKQFYYAGETVNGEVCVNAKKKFACSMIVLFIEGTESCEFQTMNNQNAKGEIKLINTSYIIAQFPPNYQLEVQHIFPFTFKFMDFLPGSYNQSKGYRANISYKLRAVIQPSSKDKPAVQNFIDVIIRQPQKSEQKMVYGQCFTKCKSCFCFDGGVSRATCFIQKNFYFPQDECIMICEADNIKCKLNMSRVNCQFIKQVTLTAANGARRVISQVLNVIQFSGVAAGQGYYGQTAERNAIKLIYKDSNIGVHPTTNGRCVKCEYFILVKPQFSGCFISTQQNEFKIRLTILQPAMIYETIVRPDEWKPSVAASSNIYLQFNESNELISSMDDN